MFTSHLLFWKKILLFLTGFVVGWLIFQGTSFKIPTVERKSLDLFRLYKVRETRDISSWKLKSLCYWMQRGLSITSVHLLSTTPFVPGRSYLPLPGKWLDKELLLLVSILVCIFHSEIFLFNSIHGNISLFPSEEWSFVLTLVL